MGYQFKAKVNKHFEKELSCMAEGHKHSVKIPFSSFPKVQVEQADGSTKLMYDLPTEGGVFEFTPRTPPKNHTSKNGNVWTIYALADAKCVDYGNDEDDSDLDEETEETEETPAAPENNSLPSDDDMPF